MVDENNPNVHEAYENSHKSEKKSVRGKKWNIVIISPYQPYHYLYAFVYTFFFVLFPREFCYSSSFHQKGTTNTIFSSVIFQDSLWQTLKNQKNITVKSSF